MRSSILIDTICRCGFWTLLYIFGFFRLDLRLFLPFAAAFVYIYVQRVRPFTLSASSVNNNNKYLPPWVLHPDTERSEWINFILKRLWPNLELYLKQSLKSMETDPNLLERLQGYHLRSLTFSSFTLGRIPPRIVGIKVHKTVRRHDEAVVDLDVDYSGDMEIKIKTAVMTSIVDKAIPISASIRNFILRGQLRLHLRPLLHEAPFVGGLSVSFVATPEIDFDLGGLANVLDFPGIGLVLRHVILDQLEQIAVMPNSLKVPILSPSSEDQTMPAFTLKEAHSVSLISGVLTVRIVEAKGLENKDMTVFSKENKSDPYAVTEITADGEQRTFSTEVVEDNLHPVWNHDIDIPVDDPDSLDDIKISIWDKDIGNRDDFLGRCVIPTQVTQNAITEGVVQDVWKILEGAQRGSVHVQVGWCELKLKDQRFHDTNTAVTSQHRDINTAVLIVFIDSCSNLLGGRTGLKLPDSKVRAEMYTGNYLETDPAIGTVDPVFEHRMSFLVKNPKTDSIKISVLDCKSYRNSNILGTVRIELSGLLSKTSLSMTNQQFALNSSNAHKDSPYITLSLVLRYLERPVRSSQNSQQSLQDLHKIMTSKMSPKTEVKDEKEKKHFERNDDDLANNNFPEMNGSPRIPDVIPQRSQIPAKRVLSPKKIQISLKFSPKTMTLFVTIHRIKSVFPLHGNVNVKIYLLEGNYRRCRNGKRKTKNQKLNYNSDGFVIFEETLEYFLHFRDVPRRRLEVSFEQSRMKIRSSVLGRTVLDLEPVLKDNNYTRWYGLSENSIDLEDDDNNNNFLPLTSSQSPGSKSHTITRSSRLLKKQMSANSLH